MIDPIASRCALVCLVLFTACGGKASSNGSGDSATGARSGTGGALGTGETPSGGAGELARGGAPGAGASGLARGGAGGASNGGTPNGGAPPVEVVALTPPKCLRDLFVGCPLEGACTQAIVGANATRSCFAQNVEALWTPVPGCGEGEMRVYRSDGTLCYSVTSVRLGPCEGDTYTWRDANGALVATGNQGSTTPLDASATITCAGGGDHSECADSPTRDCSWSWLRPPTCAPGPCGGDAGPGAVGEAGPR